ncbi:MAG: LuxR C-terminal-related transcriptional regulator [Chloroflexota bacterium]|nr:LuxR C-terminal-related transcriptional regulator [Chloroflexota bacterium]
MDRTGIDVLSPLERDVAGLLADGAADAEIGRRLGLTPAAVATIIEQFVLWLGVRDRTQVAEWARGIGLRAGRPARSPSSR